MHPQYKVVPYNRSSFRCYVYDGVPYISATDLANYLRVPYPRPHFKSHISRSDTIFAVCSTLDARIGCFANARGLRTFACALDRAREADTVIKEVATIALKGTGATFDIQPLENPEQPSPRDIQRMGTLIEATAESVGASDKEVALAILSALEELVTCKFPKLKAALTGHVEPTPITPHAVDSDETVTDVTLAKLLEADEFAVARFLEDDGLIAKTPNGYEVTDEGRWYFHGTQPAPGGRKRFVWKASIMPRIRARFG